MRPIAASALVLAFILGYGPHVPAVNAEPLFSARTDYQTGYSPAFVAIGDLNGDGKQDLAVANAASNTVSVLLGVGNGSFGVKTDFVTGSTPVSVAIGDLNADGKLDLAVASDGSNAVSVLLGIGDGRFGARTDFYTANTPVSVAIGDLNGDGNPDLAVANINSDVVSVLPGNGDGSFAERTNYRVGRCPTSVAIGDLNRDGKPDLAVAGLCANTVSVLIGNGDGTFWPNGDYGTGINPYSVAFGDLNGDGKLDLAVANFASETVGVYTVSVLLGTGNGTLLPRSDFRSGANGRSIAIADLDQDGMLDVAVANEGPNTVSVLPGNGDGTFGPYTHYGTGTDPVSVAVADLSGDGRPDLAVANINSRSVSVLLNLCPPTPVTFDLDPNTLNLHSMGHWVTGTFEPEPPASPEDIDIASILLNGSVPVDPSAPVSIGDADGDGLPDLSVKFDRAAVELAVEEGDAVTVTVTGEIGNGCFEATDVIRVIRAHVEAPSAGSVLQVGSRTEVRWVTPAGVEVQWVALLSSIDDGATWTLQASQLPNIGTCLWTVPNSVTEHARIALVLVESSDESGIEVNGVLGMSDRFVIAAPLAVGGTTVGFALHGAVPNPGRGLTVSFSLRDGEPATLAVYDVAGRELSRREVGTLGAGRHVVTLSAAGVLAPGIYLVHLIQGEHRLVARAVVAR